MNVFVVDTNVAVTASGRADQAGPVCVLSCVKALEEITTNGRIVLDSEMLILTEYMQNLSLAGQPGVGDAFLKWVWQYQSVVERCEKVSITPENGGFREFPPVPELAGFDPDDRMYVAVAIASPSRPKVLNAVDSDWWNYRHALRKHGVRVKNLCPHQFARQAL
jgi:hypothetical protein